MIHFSILNAKWLIHIFTELNVSVSNLLLCINFKFIIVCVVSMLISLLSFACVVCIHLGDGVGAT